MRILVINGECIQVNTSSNLCNLAYLRGLAGAGHDVDLLSADGHGYAIDKEMIIPKGVRCYTYRGLTIYERASRVKKWLKGRKARPSDVPALQQETVHPGHSRSVPGKIKQFIFSLYGVHGTYIKFANKARRFRSEDNYDLVISLSTPASSHLLASRLLSSGHVKSRHWIQIWEDPWYEDVYGFTGREEVFREERRLLSLADRVCYVSPITLSYQKKRYPESAGKMFWAPLPAYYQADDHPAQDADPALFGYFGEYSLPARNLKPFYLAARCAGVEVNICGNSNQNFEATDQIHIYPRLGLGKLRPIEDRTGVLVFLCNCKGGQIPGKIYQYAATRKTILFILDGKKEKKHILREFFEPYRRFVFCNNDQEDIERTIRRITAGDIGDVVNQPLNDFDAAGIVRKIIEEGTR